MYSSSSSQDKYDVFLSYSNNTRNKFTSHLYSALRREKIKTFIDDDIKKGDKILPTLLKVIEESKISIIIFSKDYTFSECCLEELVKILECRKTNGQIVVPVFYGINPSDVRCQNQNEIFERDKLQRWRVALTEACNLCGWDSSLIRPESILVEDIVRDVVRKLKDISHSDELKRLVGIDSHIEQIKSLLCIGKSVFRIIGIWGIGGTGKTTIARAIFHQISSQFESCCFIPNVRQESEKWGGLISLRDQILCQILEENVKICSHCLPHYIEDRLQHKKVFIVLDDVNNLEQLEFLVRGLNKLFAPGSRILVTTRDKKVLSNYEVDVIYKVGGLNDCESFQVFSNYAFKQNHPPENLKLPKVKYAKGNSSAVKVLGSSLSAKRKLDWIIKMQRLKGISNPKIHDLLKMRYDGLRMEEKNMFPDIACLFKVEMTNKLCRIGVARQISTLTGCYVMSTRTRLPKSKLWPNMVHGHNTKLYHVMPG